MTVEAPRVRRRQGSARLRGGVPYSDRSTTLSLLPGAAIGEWLARNEAYVRGVLLDAGCGNRPFAEWYAPRVASVVGLDAAPLDGVDVVGFADRLPFADGSFDTVLATEVLEHVGDLEHAVLDIVRVLKPGGYVLVTVPFLYPVHEAPYDFRRLTHFGLRAVLERHGLDVVKLEAKGGAGMLVAHAFVLALVDALDTVGTKVGRRRLTEGQWVRPMIAFPQELAIRWRATRGRRNSSAGDITARACLGYMAVARKPDVPASAI